VHQRVDFDTHNALKIPYVHTQFQFFSEVTPPPFPAQNGKRRVREGKGGMGITSIRGIEKLERRERKNEKEKGGIGGEVV
jgi:hypothetical protein